MGLVLQRCRASRSVEPVVVVPETTEPPEVVEEIVIPEVIPEILIEEVINDIVALQEFDDLIELVTDAPEDNSEFTFVDKKTQCL